MKKNSFQLPHEDPDFFKSLVVRKKDPLNVTHVESTANETMQQQNSTINTTCASEGTQPSRKKMCFNANLPSGSSTNITSCEHSAHMHNVLVLSQERQDIVVEFAEFIKQIPDENLESFTKSLKFIVNLYTKK